MQKVVRKVKSKPTCPPSACLEIARHLPKERRPASPNPLVRDISLNCLLASPLPMESPYTHVIAISFFFFDKNLLFTSFSSFARPGHSCGRDVKPLNVNTLEKICNTQEQICTRVLPYFGMGNDPVEEKPKDRQSVIAEQLTPLLHSVHRHQHRQQESSLQGCEKPACQLFFASQPFVACCTSLSALLPAPHVHRGHLKQTILYLSSNHNSAIH